MNITKAIFNGCETFAIAAPALYQYDYGQVLQIEGLELPTAYQVEFSNSAERGETVAAIGDEGGVEIPNELLQSGTNIYAFIFLHNSETDGETEYKITIYVTPRPSRSDDTPTPEQGTAIDQAIAALNDAVERADAAADAAQGSDASAAQSAADAAESAASAAGSAASANNSAQTAAQRATAAQAAAQNAAVAAAAATESAETATESAADAARYATGAQESAESAAQSADDAASAKTAAQASAAAAAGSAQSAAVAAQTASGAVTAVQQSAETASAAAQSAGESATAAGASAAAAAASATEAQRIEEALEPLDGLPGRVGTLEEALGFALYPAWVQGSYTSYGYQNTTARKRTDKLPAGRYSAAINADYVLTAVEFVSDTRGVNIVKSESGGRFNFESDGEIILNTRRADNTSIAAMTDAEINAIWQLKGEPITDRVAELEEAVDGYGAAAQPAAGTDMVATRSIASGEYFAGGYGLYQATAAIASGETIVPGTNCTQTSSAAALNALRSGKQNALTFDSAPTAGSANPVTSGGVAAAVAEIDGEVIELKSSINHLTEGVIEVEQGQWSVSTGAAATGNGWCRSVGYIDPNMRLVSSNETIRIYLQAYQNDGTYVGTWDQTTNSFSKSYHQKHMGYQSMNLRLHTANFPQYKWKVSFGALSGSITPDSVYSEMQYDDGITREEDYSFSLLETFTDKCVLSGNTGYLDIPNTGYFSTGFIPVYAGQKLLYYGSSGGGACSLYGYDAEHVPTSRLIGNGQSGSQHYEGIIVTIPDGTAFVRAGYYNAGAKEYWALKTNQDGWKYYQEKTAIPSNAVKVYTDGSAVGDMRSGYASGDQMVDSTNTYRFAANEAVMLPFAHYSKLLVKFKDSNFMAQLRLGDWVYHMDLVESPKQWFYDGDIIDIRGFVGDYAKAPNYYVYSCGLPKSQATPGTTNSTALAMTSALIESAGFELYALLDDIAAKDANNVGQIANAIVSDIRYGNETYVHKINDQDIVIFHASDAHGDDRRVRRMFDIADIHGADVAAVTGDIVSEGFYSGMGWFHEIVNEHDVVPAITMGNHEVAYATSMDDDAIYAAFYAPIATRLGSSGKTYYYRDFPKKKLRLISINLYQYGGTDRARTHFGTDQIAWLISTLSGTPSGYGIIIIEHACQRPIRWENPEDKTFFTPMKHRIAQTNGTINPVTYNGGIGAPVYDLIDAFIGRTTINRTYSQTGDVTSITVSADFSNIDETVQFIGYMNGHLHEDTICAIPGTSHKQMALNITCSNAGYWGASNEFGNDITDLGRLPFGPSQDAFNVYSIDLPKRKIKVVRVGADRTLYGEGRKYMELDFCDWTAHTPTIADHGTDNENPNAVHTDYVPATYGKAVKCNVTRPTDGYYAFGFVEYDANYNKLKTHGYDSQQRYPYGVVENANTAYIRFNVGQYSLSGSYINMDSSSFASGQITVDVSDR